MDRDAEQLAAAARNLSECAPTADFVLVRADATALPLPSASVDAVLSCPPFGRQFAAAASAVSAPRDWPSGRHTGGVPTLYRSALREIARCLRPGVGRAALLVEVGFFCLLGGAGQTLQP